MSRLEGYGDVRWQAADDPMHVARWLCIALMSAAAVWVWFAPTPQWVKDAEKRAEVDNKLTSEGISDWSVLVGKFKENRND